MNNKRKIIVLGASANPNRTSYMATKLLKNKGYKLQAVGNKPGKIDDIILETEIEHKEEAVDAITVFLNPKNQVKYYDYIIKCDPRAIIFNPGTENPELEALLAPKNTKIISCCTIALLAIKML